MFNRQEPPDNAMEMIPVLRHEPFASNQGCGNQTGLPGLARGIEAMARDALQASLILQRTHPPPPLAATRAERASMKQRGPVQDECGTLDPLDRAAMDAVEGRVPRIETERSIPLVYPEVADESPKLAVEVPHWLI
jgi:hypothetical protein